MKQNRPSTPIEALRKAALTDLDSPPPSAAVQVVRTSVPLDHLPEVDDDFGASLMCVVVEALAPEDDEAHELDGAFIAPLDELNDATGPLEGGLER